MGCKPPVEVDLDPSANVPASIEEEHFVSNSWCGYDYMSYQKLPKGSKASTLFKVKMSINGIVKVETVTMSTTFFDRQNFNLPCNLVSPNTIQCLEGTVSYQINNNGRGILTNLLTLHIPELNLTQLSVCAPYEMNQF